MNGLVFKALVGGALALAVPTLARAQEGSATARPKGGRYDAEIQQKVRDKLSGDKFKNVKVEVLDQIVELTGTVELMANKSEADRKAHRVDKVRGVENDIQVGGKQVADAELREKLSDKLRYDRMGQGNVFNAITLNVQNGVVTLGGEVRTEVDRDSAISEVEHTAGVKDVNEDIKVSPTSIFDDDLRINIARAIYGGPLQRYANDPQAPIRIVVNNGHVTLYGVVDSQVDKQLAESQARSVPNVFSVDSKIIVAGQSAKK